MRPATLLLVLSTFAFADTSPRNLDIVETSWSKGSWALGTNDEITVDQREGATVAVQQKGGGETALIRRRIYPLTLPCTITWKVRWTEAPYGDAFPSVHILFDPPALKDDWWKQPIAGPAGGGPWSGKQNTFLLHFSTNAGWRRAGMTAAVEQGPQGHAWSPPANQWIQLRAVVERGKITVRNDREKIVECAADLTKFRTFTVAIGDQTSTRVELDELTIEPRAR